MLHYAMQKHTCMQSSLYVIYAQYFEVHATNIPHGHCYVRLKGLHAIHSIMHLVPHISWRISYTFCKKDMVILTLLRLSQLQLNDIM